jgi:hypothetical protein
MRSRRDRWISVATAVCAAGAPVTAAGWVSARTTALAEHVGVTGGGVARIGGVDAGLTGTIRLSNIAFGDLVAADAIEVSVAPDALLAGTLRADEIRVTRPRVAIQVDGDGDSDVARLARRLLVRDRDAGNGSPGASRLRRIVVSAGTLSAHVAGIGELVAEGVELIPDARGVRVITGAVRIGGHAGPLGVELGFTRSATELTLPDLQLGRMLAVGGAGAITVAPSPGSPGSTARRAQLRNVTVGWLAETERSPGHRAKPEAPDERSEGSGESDVRGGRMKYGLLAADGSLKLRAAIDDSGIPRPFALDVKPRGPEIVIRGERIPLGTFATFTPHGVDVDAAHATGRLGMRRDAERVLLDVDGTVDDVRLDHPGLAPVPVPLAAAVRASIAVSSDAITVPFAAIDLGAAHGTATGWLRRGAPASGQLDVSLATVECGDLLASLPAELRGPLDGLALTGSLGGRARLAVDLAAPAGEGVDLTTSITGGCRAEAEPPAADVTRLAALPGQGSLDEGHPRTGKGEPSWVHLRKLPSHVAGAFVSAEDAKFYDHAGFDLRQIAKSLEIDLREHRLARGGSTISQQLVKNVFLPPRRSLDRKLQEAVLTWRLEERLDKQQILERYLNIIELGPRVFGLTAAAKHWFDEEPRDLSARQAAFLAALTSEPTAMSRRVRRAGGLDPESAARVDLVLRAMRRDGVLSPEQLSAAKTAPLRLASAAVD